MLGKFLAAWAFCAIALAADLPVRHHRQHPGQPGQRRDRLGLCRRAAGRRRLPRRSARRCRRLTKNQVIAFVLAVAVCFVFAVASYPVVTDFLSPQHRRCWPTIARRLAVIDRFQDFTRGVVSAARPDLLRHLHRLLAVPEHRDRRTAEGGLNRCAALWFSVVGVVAVAAIVIGINMFADARLANVQRRSDAEPASTRCRPARGRSCRAEGADHAAAVLLAPARQHRAGLRRLRRPRARDAAANTPPSPTARSGWNSTIPSRSATPRTAPWPTACKACRSIRPATQVYFGLAGTNLLDDERTIAFFQPERERFLEYDLTKLVYELSNPKRPVVGVMSSLPLDGDPRADDDDARASRAAGQPYASTHAAAADQHGEDRADRRAGDRPGHPGAAGGRGAEPVGRHALRHRPVRHARRPADGDGRSVERGDGGARPHPTGMPPTDTAVRPEEAVRRLGHRVRSEPGGRRPDRRLAGARAARTTGCRR